VATLVVLGCAHLTPKSRLTCSVPPAVRERPVTSFAEAAAALDAPRAEALASTRAQHEYAAVLRLLRERRLSEVDRPLVKLIRSPDRDIAATAWALTLNLLTDRTLPELPKVKDHDQRVYLEALAHTRSAERWSSPVRPARQALLTYTGDLVLLDVEINGRPAKLMLDTGAEFTVIGSRLAERAGVRALPGRTKVTGIADGVDARLASVRLDIGAARIENHPVWLVDSSHLEQLSAAGGLPMLGGVIGWNTVKELRITMDRNEGALDIERSPRRAHSQTGFFWFGQPLVTVQSENGLAMYFQLDTGLTGSRVSRALAGEAGFGNGYSAQLSVVSLDGRRMVEGSAHPDTALYVGGARLVLSRLWATPPRGKPYGPRDGVLGADALVRGHIVIDFGSGEVSISPLGANPCRDAGPLTTYRPPIGR